MRTFKQLALSLALCAVTSSSAFADLQAYEGFDYPEGSPLTGQNGGFGFSTAWGTTPGSATVVTPGSEVDPLITSGGKLRLDGTAGSVAIFRDLAAPRGADGTTTWISLFGERFGPKGGTFGPGGGASWLRPQNFALFDGGTEKLSPGEGTRNNPATTGVDDDVWGLVVRGNAAHAATRWSTATLEGQSFVLVRIDHGVGDIDTAYMWVNASLDAEPDTLFADVTTTNTVATEHFGFTRIRPFAGNPSAQAGNIAATGFYDEFRLGDTWADVVPVVPEPSSVMVLGGFALAALSARRRTK